MIETFSFAPHFMLYIAFIMQSLLLIAYVIYPDDYASEVKWMQYLHEFFVHAGLSLFLLFGLAIFDAGLFWVTGQWMYADWRFQLPSVILILIMGAQYVMGSMLIKPKISDLVYFCLSLALMIYFLHVHPIFTDLMSATDILVIMMVVFVVIYLIIWILDLVLENNIDNWRDKNKLLWNVEDKFKKVFSRKVNLILWVILLVETFLKLFGSSLFTF